MNARRLPVKLDEDLSASVGACLASSCEVRTVVAQGWTGLPDAEIWRRVQAEREYFITADKGFGDLREYPPGTHAAVLVLRADRESILAYQRLLESVIERTPLTELVGTVAVASPAGVRIRQ